MTAPVPEDDAFDRKSLRLVQGSKADFAALARDCVCFANSAGGTLLVGIEDDDDAPPSAQRIDAALLGRIRKRVGELSVNVQLAAELSRHDNGGDYITLAIARAAGIASTSDGRYFLRVGDTCQPIVGDDVMRLANERPATPWEEMTSQAVPRTDADAAKVARFGERTRASDRVKASVKDKTADELLAHYDLTRGDVLTNLGLLLVGARGDRARLGTAPIVQAIKYDERGVKVAKWSWDDHALSPIELIDAIWEGIPDFRESYELPDGMFRTQLPAYEEDVVREVLVNALVHRPYTQSGEIFLNLHPDRLQVVNPGRLPLGVTPQNILHASRRRNHGLARVFHDQGLMEREGSGFDLLYDRLLTTGRAPPAVMEGADSTHVTIERRVLHPGVVRLISDADERHQLSQRERIALGLLAQGDGMSAEELARGLELSSTPNVRPWIDRLLELGLVEQSGRKRGTRYHVPPELLRDAGLETKTTLKRLSPHRLRALVVEDLQSFPGSSISEIHERIGAEIPRSHVKRALDDLIAKGQVSPSGEKRWRRYALVDSIDPNRQGDHRS